MLRWFPRFQVANKYFSCRPNDLNLVVTNFMFCIHVKQPLPPGNNSIAVNKYYYIYNLQITPYLQCFTSLLALGITCGFLFLVITLISIACSQFEKVKAAILDIRQQHMTSHHGVEDEHDNAIANCDLQAKLNACIRHHHEIMA